MRDVSLKIPLFLAVDVDEAEQALKLADQVKDFVGGFKLGPRLTYRYGGDFVTEMSKRAPVFVDNKYCDIPNTMEHAIRSTFVAGASFCTIHANCGPVALEHLAKVEEELNQERPFQLLTVTVLTSINDGATPPNWVDQPIDQHVKALASSAINAGLSGLVSSAHEVKELRSLFPEAFLLTPGIRFPDDAKGDQKRVTGPKEAIEMGSTALVVGRPIYQAPDPAVAAQRFAEALK